MEFSVEKINDEVGIILDLINQRDLADLEKIAILKSAAATIENLVNVKTMSLVINKMR